MQPREKNPTSSAAKAVLDTAGAGYHPSPAPVQSRSRYAKVQIDFEATLGQLNKLIKEFGLEDLPYFEHLDFAKIKKLLKTAADKQGSIRLELNELEKYRVSTSKVFHNLRNLFHPDPIEKRFNEDWEEMLKPYKMKQKKVELDAEFVHREVIINRLFKPPSNLHRRNKWLIHDYVEQRD